jgi:hypothetical protein
MKDVTTVQLRRAVVKELKALKKYSRQTYNEVIMDLVNNAKTANQKRENKNQYDEFLHTVQRAKMKELWDNEEDEAWENA